MKKIKFLTIALAATLPINSCKETPKRENSETTTTEILKNDSEDAAIVTTTSTDKNGKKLEVSLNNTKGTATIKFKGETAELISEKPASGIWYTNDLYELRGKGNDLDLKKDGNIIFEHQDDIVRIESKNDLGDVLNMTFNNTEGTVYAYLNGGEQINLVQEKAASGIWYKNEVYELRGKGDSYQLSKDGETVFEN